MASNKVQWQWVSSTDKGASGPRGDHVKFDLGATFDIHESFDHMNRRVELANLVKDGASVTEEICHPKMRGEVLGLSNFPQLGMKPSPKDTSLQGAVVVAKEGH